jgi:transposase
MKKSAISLTDQYFADYKSGMTIKAISEKYGKTENAVRVSLRRRGVTSRAESLSAINPLNTWTKPGRPPNLRRRFDVKRDYLSGLKPKEIAKKQGVSNTIVYRDLKRMGFDVVQDHIVKDQKSKRRHLEDDLQIAVADYLRLAVPGDVLWFHVPNGGKRNKITASILKKMGVRRGVADILFFRESLQKLAIEMKTQDGSQSKEQKDFERLWTLAGGIYVIARSIDEVKDTLRSLGFLQRRPSSFAMQAKDD